MRSAEDWLASRGIERQEIRVRLTEPEPEPAPEVAPAPVTDDDDEAEFDHGPEIDLAAGAAPLIPEVGVLRAVPDRPTRQIHAQEATRVATAADLERRREADLEVHEPRQRPSLGDDVSIAMAYIRSATASTPMAEGRLRRRLNERETPGKVIDLALQRARDEGLVDDDAFASALVREWHDKGHAGARIRNDLYTRGFDRQVVERVVAAIESPDPEAAAFAVAKERAESLRALEPEVAFRRLVAHVARRGHGEGLARKVARQVLWTDREPTRNV